MCKTKARDNSIDIMRAFAIFMVITGHVLTLCVEDGSETLLCGVIYHIHIPLFLVISGILAKDKDLNIVYWKNLFVRFIIPYFFWNAIITIFFLGYKRIHEGGWFFTFQHISEDRWMWFIPTFLLITIIWQIMKPLPYYKRLLIGGVLIYAFKGLSLDLWCFIWYGLAACLKPYITLVANNMTCMLSALFLFVCIPFTRFDHSYALFFFTDPFKTDWYTFPLQFVIGITFCIFILSLRSRIFFLSKNMDENAAKSSFSDILGGVFSRIGKNTLQIYMLQSLLVEAVLPRIIHMPNHGLSLLAAIIIGIIMTLICSYIIDFTSYINICKIILWGKNTALHK